MNFHRLLLPPFWLSCFIAGTRLLYMVAGPGSCGGGKLSFVEPGLPVSEWHHLLLCVSWTRIGFPRSRLWDGGLGTEIWVLFFFFFFFLEERVPLGSIPVRQERKQDWSEGEAGMACSNPRAPAHPTGTSGAAMPLQSGPELGEEGLSLRMSLSC